MRGAEGVCLIDVHGADGVTVCIVLMVCVLLKVCVVLTCVVLMA